MDGLFASSLFSFLLFCIAGSVIVYLILDFDKKQRRKLKTILLQTDDVQPIFMVRAANQKLNAIKSICEADTARTQVSRQLDELVAQYDKGNITLADYCNRLSTLLAKVA